MTTGVAKLLGADVAVAVTGVGGPGHEEGKRRGTVWFGVTVDGLNLLLQCMASQGR